MVTAAWQTVERIAWASDPSAPSVCEINAVLSCSSVYSHWQSAALGIPNSLIALPVFAIIAATGLAGVLGSSLTSRFVALVFALTVIMTAFVTWYLEQSALAIGVLCLFCIGCAATILLAGWASPGLRTAWAPSGPGGWAVGLARWWPPAQTWWPGRAWPCC